MTLKILQNFYSSHEFIVGLTIERISFPLLSFILDNIGNKEVAKSAERLFESISSFSDKMLGSILDRLKENVCKKRGKVEKDLQVLDFSI
jgi:hypothetical protein